MTRCTGTLRIGASGTTGALPPSPDVVGFVGGWSFYSALYMLDNTWTVKDSEGSLAPDKFTFLRTSGPLVVFPTLNPRDVGNVTVRCDRVVGRSDSLVSAEEITAAFDPRPPNFADFVITVHRGCTATPSLLPPRTPTVAPTGTATPSPTTTGPWSATLSPAPTLTQSLPPSTSRTSSLPPPPTDTKTPAPTRTVSGSTSESQRPPQPRCDTTLSLIGGATTGHALRERGAVLTLAVPDTSPVTFESDVAVLKGSVLVSGEVRNGDEAALRSAREDPRSLGQQLSKAHALVEFAVPPHPPPDVTGAALPAPFSRLKITVPPMPGLLLRPSVTSLLTVTVMPTAVSCAAAANSTSVVVSVEVEPSVPPALAAAADAATAAGTVATAAAIGSVAAAADLQTVAALSLMQCGGSSEEASRRTSWLLGPLNIGGGSIGAIGGTLVLLAAATFLPLTIAAVVSVVRRHRAKQSCDGVSGSKADWRSVTALVKFPSLQLKLLNLAVPGLAAHSFTLLFRSDIEPLALFSAALCLAAPVGIVLLARYAASPRFEDGPDRLQFLKYAAISTTAWGPAVRSGPRWALFCAVVPVGRWGPPQVTARVGSPFTQLRPIWAEAFAAEPWLTAAAAGFVVSVPVAPGPWCAAQFGLLIAVTCVGTAAATYAKPYRVPALLYLRVASTVLLTAVIACVMLVALEADTAAPSSTLYSVITGLSVLQAFLTALRAVYSVGLKVAEMCFWNEDSRRHPWIDGLSVLHRPELPCNDALGLLHTSASVECPSPSLGSTPYAASPVLSATKGIGSGHSFSTVSSNRSPYRRPPRLGSVPLKKGRRRPESKWAEEEEEEPFQL